MAMAMAMDLNMASRRRIKSYLSLRVLVTSVCAFVLAAAAGMSAYAGVMRSKAPDKIPPILQDPLVPLAQWNEVVTANPQRIPETRTREVALAALRLQPLNASALRLLALSEDSQMRHERAAYLAGLSEQVSRRDLLTQLILIEYAVKRNDVDGALAHYDKALRASPDSRQILFPVLTEAMADPAIRGGIAKYVERGASWVGGFLFTALDMKDGAESVANLLLQPTIPSRNALIADLAPNLLSRLVDQQKFELAKSILFKMPDTPNGLLNDLSFSEGTTNPAFGPFSWTITDNPDVNLTFERVGEDQRQLYVAMPPGAVQNPVLLRRVFQLPPGEYRFDEHRKTIVPGGSLVWQIDCIGGHATRNSIWRFASQDDAGGTGPLRISRECIWQQLSLVALQVVSAQSAEIAIEGVTLQRVKDSGRIESSQPAADASPRQKGHASPTAKLPTR
jgi:hypothetical protein